MGSYEAFKTDRDAERSGVLVQYGDFRVLLARAGGANKDYQKTLDIKSRPYRRALKTDTLSDEMAQEILKAAYVAAVIKDWEVTRDSGAKTPTWERGIWDPDNPGQVLEFNPQNVHRILDEMPDLWADLREMAGTNALYRVAVREAAEGN